MPNHRLRRVHFPLQLRRNITMRYFPGILFMTTTKINNTSLFSDNQQHDQQIKNKSRKNDNLHLFIRTGCFIRNTIGTRNIGHYLYELCYNLQLI